MFLGKDTVTLHELLGYKVVGELTKWCQMTENQVLESSVLQWNPQFCNGILSFVGDVFLV